MYLLDLQHEVGNWSNRNFPNNSYVEPLLGIGEEVGELNHAVLKARQNIRGDGDEHYEEAVDAVGDIVIYLADFCSRYSICLASAVEKTWGKVMQRDWVTDSVSGGET